MGRASNLVYGNTLKSTYDSIFPAVIAMAFHFICVTFKGHAFMAPRLS